MVNENDKSPADELRESAAKFRSSDVERDQRYATELERQAEIADLRNMTDHKPPATPTYRPGFSGRTDSKHTSGNPTDDLGLLLVPNLNIFKV